MRTARARRKYVKFFHKPHRARHRVTTGTSTTLSLKCSHNPGLRTTRNCGYLSLFTKRKKHSVDETDAEAPLQTSITGSAQDCRTCGCMITRRRPLHVEQEAHTYRSSSAAGSPTEPPRCRPSGAAFPLPRHPRSSQTTRSSGQATWPRGIAWIPACGWLARHLADKASDSSHETYGSSQTRKWCSSHRSVQGTG